MVESAKDSNQKLYAKWDPFSVWGHTRTIVKYDFHAIRGIRVCSKIKYSMVKS
jgi:hypothetical protein